jgi:hypothetical protein
MTTKKKRKKTKAVKERTARKKSAKGKKIPAKQGKSKVGYKKPLWVYFCQYMDMTDAKLAKLDRKKLTQAQQTALKLVENAKDGKYSGSERLAQHVFNREEGKPTEYLIVGSDDSLSDEECEQVRGLLKKSC